MKSKLFLFIFASIFLISLAQATSVSSTLLFHETTENTLTIIDGNSFGISFSGNSLGEASMTASIIIYNSFGELISTPFEITTSENSFYFNEVLEDFVYDGADQYKIIARVTGSSGNTDSETLYLIVLPNIQENSAPIITSTPSSEIEENQDYEYLVIAEDADNDDLTYELIQKPSWLKLSSNRIYGTAPEVTEDYQYVATVKVSDGIEFVLQTFIIDVVDTNIQENSAPVMVNVVPYITIYPAVVSTSFPIQAEDADNDDLTYELVPTQNNGTVKIKRNRITYTPNTNFFGIETIKYRAFDGTDYSEIAITIIERKNYANNAPVAENMYFSIQEDEEIAAPFLVNDADDMNLTYYVRVGNTIVVYHENLFRYNPSNGPGTFTYEYWANDGEQDSNHATITIIVNEISDTNTAPVVNDIELTMYQFEQIEIELDSFDADGDELIYTITMESGLEINTTSETITYPSGNAIGTYTITYQAFDGELFSNIGTITIHVLETLDTTAPEITIISPEEKEYKDNDILFKIEVNEDADLWFVIDGTNYTFENSIDGSYERTINNFGNKDYIVTFYARDLAGNIAEKSIEFSVDQNNNRNNDDDENVLENSYVPGKSTRRTIGLGAAIGFDNEMEGSELNWLLIVIILILLILFILILLIKKLRENKPVNQKVYTPKETYY